MKNLFKVLYDALPFKRQFYIFVKRFYTPSFNIYKHLSFKGIFKVEVSGKEFRMMHYGYELENEIFWKGLEGGWESECMAWWIQLCKNSEVILDIGASTGLYALIAQTLNQDAKVFAFEPMPKVFDKLLHNVRLNNFEIYCCANALSDYNGTGIIALPDVEMLYSVTINQPLSPDQTGYKEHTVETMRLATFIENHNLKKIDLMKIDVETHEGEVLKGMGYYLAQFKPAMLIEILNEEVAAKVEELTSPLGYQYYHIQPGGNLEKVNKLKGHAKYYNYLIKADELN